MEQVRCSTLPPSLPHLTSLFIIQNVVTRKDPPHYWAEVAISPSGSAVALATKGGFLWGGSTDFKVSKTSPESKTARWVLASSTWPDWRYNLFLRFVRLSLICSLRQKSSRCSGELKWTASFPLYVATPAVLTTSIHNVQQFFSHRGGKDFFVVVVEKMMFAKGTGKHWTK